MKISTEIGSISRNVGERKAVEYVAKAGFDAWDFSMFKMHDGPFGLKKRNPLVKDNAVEFARELRKIGEDNGIVCNQAHAPFPSFSKNVRPYIERALECTAEAGGKICIVHPGNNHSAQENAELYAELLPIAKDYGVKIAIENMWNWDYLRLHATPAACSTPQSFLEHLNAIPDENIVACLDIGHAEMRGLHTSAVEMIYALGDHLQALHIHDNDQWYDSHQIPFSMKIDFQPILKALHDIHYSGYFTLEASNYMYFYGRHNALKGVKALKNAAQKLAEMYDALD